MNSRRPQRVQEPTQEERIALLEAHIHQLTDSMQKAWLIIGDLQERVFGDQAAGEAPVPAILRKRRSN